MDHKSVCLKIKEIVEEVAGYIGNQHENRTNLHIESKGKHNFVTHVDKEAERMLVDKLGLLLPEAGFIAEEGTSNKQGEFFNWIIDPLDGTTNFIHGVPPFAISVALAGKNEIIAGVIYEFGLNEYFYAWKDGGAWLNDNPIRVSTVSYVKDALIATGFPYTNFTYFSSFLESMKWFMLNSHGLRRLGSAATDIAYVACGRYDGFYEYGLRPWDVAAGTLILKEAGGAVSDFKGENSWLFGEEIICSNETIFNEFQSVIMEIMKPE